MALEKDYEVLGRLGEGAFGKVYKALHRASSDVVAVKEIKLGAQSWDEALKSLELQALKSLRHPYIIRLRELLRSQHDGSLYYIFEFIDSDLCRLVRANPQGLEEVRAATLTRQLLAGLAHVHQQGFFHRDIKPENILYQSDGANNESIRIADFGEARSLRARPPFTAYVGTRWYRAPECLLRDGHYSSPVDIWSTGLIFAELLRGAPMFCGTSSIDQLHKIFTVFGQPFKVLAETWPEFRRLSESLRFRVPENGCGLSRVLPSDRVSSSAEAIITEILTVNPRKRPPARRILEQNFFTQLPTELVLLERCDSRSRPGTAGSSRPSSRVGTDAPQDCAPETVTPRSHGQSCLIDNDEAEPMLKLPTGRGSTAFVEELDLDAELDKILSSPKGDELGGEDFSATEVLGEASQDALEEVSLERSISAPAGFNFGPSSRSTSTEPPVAAVEPSVDALLESICAELQIDTEVSQNSEQKPQQVVPSTSSHVSQVTSKSNNAGSGSEFKKSPWTQEEAIQLRRTVKRIIKQGQRDKKLLWVEASAELPGRSPQECRIQYAEDYKKHKAEKRTSDGGKADPD